MQSIDILIIIAYLAVVVWAGVRHRGESASADEFFTARRGFHGLLGTVMVGLSMAATLFSGISFVVYTSLAYGFGARIAICSFGLIIAWIILRWWFLPRFLSSAGNHPYDIIEQRFGGTVRLAVSAMFVLLRVGWMAVMLVAPTVVVMGAAHLGSEWFWPIVLATGITCTLYTAIGGIRGVIVTDAIQFVVMAAGILVIIAFILSKIGLPVGEILHRLDSAGRLDLFDLSFDLTQTISTPGILIGMTVGNLANYVGDLMMLQRYMAAESPRSAARSFVFNIAGAIGLIVTLVIVGLLLWVWYGQNPDPNLPAKTDQILPYFIARELPSGLSGLLIASILAATMSSMTSGIIALAGTIVNDWVKRFGRTRSPAELLRFGKAMSIGIGIVATLAAGLVSRLGTLFQISQIVLGAFLGPMLVCMLAAVSDWRVKPKALLLGMIAGTAAGWIVAGSAVSVVWIPTVTTLVTFLITVAAGRRPLPAPASRSDELQQSSRA